MPHIAIPRFLPKILVIAILNCLAWLLVDMTEEGEDPIQSDSEEQTP